MLQGTLAKSAAGDCSYGVSHASVNLNIDNEALPLGWIINPEELTAQHRHPHA
jgi:hypothetical protein